MSKLTKLKALRAALIEGEKSGASTPFDFEMFIEGKKAGEPPSRPAPPTRERP
jgi:antitoxin ParD1/3/4